MKGSVLIMNKKPLFSSDQIINMSDLQRKWRSAVEPKLNQFPFLMMLSGSEPRATILSYEKFEELWQKVNEASELELKMELLCRIIENEKENKTTIPFADVVAKTDITAEDLEGAPDVQLEDE